MIKKLRSLLLAVILAAPFAANASLIGQTANCDMQPSGIWACSPTSAAVVDPGAEFQLLLGGGAVPMFSVDIGPTSILLTLINSGTLDMGAGEVLTISGLSGILGASLNFSTADSGIDGGDIAFTSSSVAMTLGDSHWSSGQQALVDISVSAVPEPATLALLGLGLAGLGFSRRKQ